MTGNFQRFILLPFMVVVLFVGAAIFGVISLSKLVFVNVWFFSVPHTLATFFRKDLRTPQKAMFAGGVFLSVWMLCLQFTRWFDLSLLVAVYFFAQQFHYSRQSYGFARLNQKTGGRTPFEVIYYPAVTLIAILGAVSRGPLNFFGYSIRNPLPFAVPAWMAATGLILLGGGALKWLPKERRIHALLHGALNGLVFALSEHFGLIWFLINILHNVQYLRLSVDTEGSPRILIVPVLLSLGLALMAELPDMILVFLAINFTHYFWDARIWRRIRPEAQSLVDHSLASR